jgi:hypothetical protein
MLDKNAHYLTVMAEGSRVVCLISTYKLGVTA